jgi:hypothetical protein
MTATRIDAGRSTLWDWNREPTNRRTDGNLWKCTCPVTWQAAGERRKAIAAACRADGSVTDC